MENEMTWSDYSVSESNDIEVLSEEQRNHVNGAILPYVALFVTSAILGINIGNRIWPQRPVTATRYVNPNNFRVRAPRR